MDCAMCCHADGCGTCRWIINGYKKEMCIDTSPFNMDCQLASATEVTSAAITKKGTVSATAEK